MAVILCYKLNAQIMPIPKYQKSDIIKPVFERQRYNSQNELVNKNDSVLKTAKVYKHKFATNESDDKNIFNSIQAANLVMKKLEDTLYFLDNQTIYLYKKKRLRTFITPSIDDSKRQPYQQKLQEIDAINKLYKNNVDSIDSINAKEDVTTDAVKERINSFAKKRDEFKAMQTQLETQADSMSNDISFNVSSQRSFYPVALSFFKKRKKLASIFNKYYYGRTDFATLQALELNRAAGITSFTSELGNGFIKTFRLSLAANINDAANNEENTDTTETEVTQNDLQKLVKNGGQLAFRISTPIYYYSNSEDFIHFTFNFINQFASDVIPEQTNANQYNISNSIGGNAAFDISTDDKKWMFYAQFPFSYIFGNPKFYNNFQFRDFSVLKGSFGVVFNSQFGIDISGVFLSTQHKIQYTPWSIGFKFTPPANAN